MKDENKKTEHDKKIVEFDIDETILEDSELDQFLRKSMQDAADVLEERLNNDPRLQGIDAPEGMFASIVRELKRLRLWEEEISDDTGNRHIHPGFGIVSDNFYSRDGTNHGNISSKLGAVNGNIYSETGKVGGSINSGRGSIIIQVGTNSGSIYREAGIAEKLANDENRSIGKDARDASQKKRCAVLGEKDKHALTLSSEMEEDSSACELKRKKRERVIRYSGIAAAVMVLFFGFGVTGEANKWLVFRVWNDVTESMGFRIATSNVGEDNEKKGGRRADFIAMKEIFEQIGTQAIDFIYLPEDMIYQNYEIIDEISQAMVFYDYNDKAFIVTMSNVGEEVTSYYSADTGAVSQGKVENDQHIEAELWKINLDQKEDTYAAEFTFNGCHYILNGMIPLEEMKKIVKDMIIL